MFAMHYDIRLPRDYDMGIVRERVASRGHALDDRTGLHLKAYLVRDIATGAPLNSYSPFYLWDDDAAAAHFLWCGGGFSSIVRDFSRPRVQTWLSGLHLPGSASSTPTRAELTHVALAPGAGLEDLAAEAGDTVHEVAAAPSTHSASFLLDPQTWTLSFVVLTVDGSGPSSGRMAVRGQSGPARAESFEVLHLSMPPTVGRSYDAHRP